MLKKIILLDSVPNDDHQTGKELFDDTISKYKLFYKSKVELHYRKVQTKEAFIAELKNILNFIEYSDEVMLHFEAHGSDNEIVLANDSHIDWKTLSDHLILINKKTQNKLHLNLVTCFGMHIGRIMDMKKTAPYKSYIAAKEEIFPREIIADNTLFYQNLLETENVYDALLKAQKIRTATKFRIQDVETVLKVALLEVIIPSLLSKDTLIAKQLLQELLKIDIDLSQIQAKDNMPEYIFKKFIKRFTYQST